jgi:hypothetical protein
VVRYAEEEARWQWQGAETEAGPGCRLLSGAVGQRGGRMVAREGAGAGRRRRGRVKDRMANRGWRVNKSR